MISVDWSLFPQIANFVVLIFVLNYLLYKPIRKILLERQQKVTGLQRGIETQHRNVREKEEAFESGIKAARARGLKEKEALIEAASEEERRIIGNVAKRAEQELSALREKIAGDAENVRKSLQNEIDAFADIIGEKILGRSI